MVEDNYRPKGYSRRPGTCTYVIEAKGAGLVKIGRSSKLSRRLHAIRCHCPHEVKVLATIDGDHEAELHCRFREQRVNREWFMFAGPIEAWAADGYKVDIESSCTLVSVPRSARDAAWSRGLLFDMD